jgi:prepilin peptidase CpaA
MYPFSVLLVGVVLIFTATCAVIDWRTRRIPNWLTVPVFALGLLSYGLNGGWSGLLFSLEGFALGFGLLLILWLLGGGGGGDVKMMGALGAWLGFALTVQVFLASAVATVFLVSVVILYRSIAGKRSRTRPDGRDRKAGRTKPAGGQPKDRERIGRIMPYAVPLAVGTWMVLVYAWSTGEMAKDQWPMAKDRIPPRLVVLGHIDHFQLFLLPPSSFPQCGR